MAELLVEDVLKIFHRYEPSRIKVWEMVRTYNPIDFAKLLYLIENVSKISARDTIDIEPLWTVVDEASGRVTSPFVNFQDKQLNIMYEPKLRLERGYDESYDATEENSIVCWNKSHKVYNENVQVINYEDAIDASVERQKPTISDIINKLKGVRYKQKKYLNNKAYDDDDEAEEDNTYDDMENLTTELMQELITKDRNLLLKALLEHNLSTKYYSFLLSNIRYLFFTENLQVDRNGGLQMKTQSIVYAFLFFINTLMNRQLTETDPKAFRYLLLPKNRRIMHRTEALDFIANARDDIVIQPLFQGFRVVMYTSPTEAKCYTRFGELHTNLTSTSRTRVPCTFEAVILPVDRLGVVRSWRYWKYKKHWVMFITDVFRYNLKILLHLKIQERLKYVDEILKDLVVDDLKIIKKIPPNYNSFHSIESKYIENRDIFDPIVGIVIKPSLLLDQETNTSIQPSYEYRFDLMYAYSLLKLQVISLTPQEMHDSVHDIRDLHINFEMADYKTVCVAYAHNETQIYLCKYNRFLHQFVHAATLSRLPYDRDPLHYKPESVYVLNSKIKPLGVCYIRIYYDINKAIIGYDFKPTDCRYSLPFECPLF
jgi:hypothetical protein